MNEGKKKKIIIGCIVLFIVLIILFILLFVKTNKENASYKIVFNSDGGTHVSEQLVKSGQYVKKPSDPEKDGYEFIEWLYNDKTFDFKTKVTKNIVLVAKWYEVDESIETFSIKFNSDGGTTISNQIVEKGKQLSKPIDPVKDGYTFKGWMLNGVIYDFSSSVENEFELVASWEKNKEVTTKSSNKSTTTTKNVVQTPSPTTTTTTKKITTTTNKQTTTTTKQKQNYTVTFNSNGGSSVASQTVVEGNNVARPNDPTREGYKFNGWTLNGNSYNFSNPVTRNITLVANWSQKNYVVRATAVDQYSPDRILRVYEDGTQISVSAIKYNGVTLCYGSNMVVNMYEISGISSVTVVLKSGSSVTASLQQ